MDTYDASVSRAFDSKASGFFGTGPHDKDEVINILSAFGHFKVESYAHQGNPNEIHYVVFFFNKASQETLEVHGTIARRYIELVRNQTQVREFPISDERIFRANTGDRISYFSQYVLHWEQATNNVVKRFYKPYDPAQAAVAARLHDFDPSKKDTLVGFTEEYTIATDVLGFSNWKDEPDLGKYNGSIGIRTVGMPNQILLHETAAFNNMAISAVRQDTTADGKTYFPIPHFCVNNLTDKGKGDVIQFVDVAVNVPHGESTNERAVGIEFVNPPIEAFKVDSAGRMIQPPEPIFNLHLSDRGVYLKTKLAGLPKLFIPLEFSPELEGGYYELAMRKNKLLNFAALKAGVGPEKKKILIEDGENVLIKYAKSDKFEHLATLVKSLVANKLIRGLDDLSKEAFWKALVRVNGVLFYLLEHGWEKKNDGTHFFVDTREPGLLTHLLIGSHVDSGLQGLYLFLKFAKKVPIAAILQLIIGFLTSDKTPAETARVNLTSKVVAKSGVIAPPVTPITKAFGDVLEIDETLISDVTSP